MPLAPLAGVRTPLPLKRRRSIRQPALATILGLFLGVVSFQAVATAAVRLSVTQAKVFYVSTLGNDRWSGKLASPNSKRTDGPFASLARARDAVRALHPTGPLTIPVTVYVRGGTYRLSETLAFSSRDSGAPSAPIRYMAYPGEKPTVSGGAVITGWQPYAGSAVPAPPAGRVWSASVPTAAPTFRQLFVNGERRIRARSPNPGLYYAIDGTASAWPAPARFTFHPGEIRATWADAGGVEIVTLQSWSETREVITAVDAASQTVTLDGAFGPYGLEANARYWIENTADALDAPGEWYLDAKSGVVYYIPKPGEDMLHASIIAPRLERLIELRGDAASGQYVTDIQFSGFTFAEADWSLPTHGHAAQAAFDVPAAVAAYGARSCVLEKNRFINLGGYAVELSLGSQQDVVAGNDFADLGGGGVKLGDPQVATTAGLASAFNRVTDNTIHDIGAIFPAAVGIWVGQSADNAIEHNEIYDTYQTAISVGWTWGDGPSGAARNSIRYNDLHDIGRGLLSDLACIYTLGAQPGTVVSHNLCHEVSRYLYGGFGVYMDAGSSKIVVDDNLVYATDDGGFISGTRSNSVTVQNNIFALNQHGQLWRIEWSGGPSFSASRNIFYWEEGELLAGSTWLAWLNDQYRFDPALYSLDSNLYYCPGDCPTYGYATFSQFFADWQASGLDGHSLVADPLFTDPAHGDFRLGAGSPAAQIGFQPIDLSSVGPRPVP